MKVKVKISVRVGVRVESWQGLRIRVRVRVSLRKVSLLTRVSERVKSEGEGTVEGQGLDCVRLEFRLGFGFGLGS